MTRRCARRVARLIGIAAIGGLALAGTVAARTPKDPAARHAAADMAIARAIVVHRGDLSRGWTAQKADTSDETCASRPDESKLVETGKARSPDFQYKDGVSSVSSVAQVFASSRDAAADWRLNANVVALKECAVEDLRAGSGRSTKLTLLSFRRLRVPQIAPRVFAFRAAIRASGSAGLGTFVTDVIAVGRGRSVGVVTFVTPSPPFKLADELALAKAVASRLPRS
jgi:hypothetical protein